MGEVCPGDMLFDERGTICRVTVVSEVFTDHDCFEIEFDDGEKLITDGDHRWLTFTAAERTALLRRSPEWRAKRRSNRESRGLGKRADLAVMNASRTYVLKNTPTGTVRTTREIAATVRARGGRVNHSVPVAGPLELPSADLPVPPYTLGAWLGDGKTVQGKLYIGDGDPGILDRVREEGFEVRKVPSEPIGWTVLGLHGQLRKAELLGNKHIPPAYLRASIGQRLELLRGLMDTDGTCDTDGGAEFTSTLRALADGVLELARTLGIKTTLTEGRAKIDGRDCGPKYRVKMTTALPIFHLARKVARQKKTVRLTQTHRYIVACHPVATVPVKCLAIDSPRRLYLVGRSMIPTHNTDLLLGLAITRHKKSILFRREASQGRGLMDRAREILGPVGRLNEQTGIWRGLPGGGQIEFAGVKDAGDEQKYRGRPHDFIGFDEADHFNEYQVRFLMGWLRTTDLKQRCRVMLCFNPPSSAEGRWLIKFFGPWLDRKHPRPALPGELRWYARLPSGDEVERPDGQPFEDRGRPVHPRSRTFFPARVKDNPYLMASGYEAQLASLPEPLRSQLLYGDFDAGLEDDPWQVIPTAWVEAAMARWTPTRPDSCHLSAIGVDVARGGADQTILARRYGPWFGRLLKYPGRETPDGPTVAALVAKVLTERPGALVCVDVIGIGAAAYDACRQLPGVRVLPVNFAKSAGGATDRAGVLSFANLRAFAYWGFRDLLDPAANTGIALPPDPELLADLTAPRWRMTATGVQIEPKEDIADRIHRSPDCGDAVVLSILMPPVGPGSADRGPIGLRA